MAYARGITKAQQTAYNRRWLADKPWYHRENRVKVPTGTYVKMLAEQDSRCAICGKHRADCGPHGLCIDHNHTTGKVRALLCTGCNIALGRVEGRLDKFVEYLSRFDAE